MSVSQLAAALHNDLLRELSDLCGVSYTGIAQAARCCRKAAITDSGMARRLRGIDTSYNFVRHFTRPKSDFTKRTVIERVPAQHKQQRQDQGDPSHEATLDREDVQHGREATAGREDAHGRGARESSGSFHGA